MYCVYVCICIFICMCIMYCVYVHIYVSATKRADASAPSPLTGFPIVWSCSHYYEIPTILGLHYYEIPIIAYKCSQFNGRSGQLDTIVCKCSQFGIKLWTLGWVVIVRLLLDLVKGKNVTDKGETHPLMSKAKQSVYLYRTEIN